MTESFKNKETFKQSFLIGLKQEFHVELKDSTVYQRYTILAKFLEQTLKQDFDKTEKHIREHHMKKSTTPPVQNPATNAKTTGRCPQ
jgi:starch phosphorylase